MHFFFFVIFGTVLRVCRKIFPLKYHCLIKCIIGKLVILVFLSDAVAIIFFFLTDLPHFC